MIAESPIVMRTSDNFIRTFTGRKFWPLAPRTEEIDVKDIAHSLSLQCRWTGHTYCHYSVAEHSIRVSRLSQWMALETNLFGHKVQASERMNKISFAREVALWGLLHDASEAYLCDMPSPLKHAPGMGQLYKQFEAQLMCVIAERFNLTPHMPSLVKDADVTLRFGFSDEIAVRVDGVVVCEDRNTYGQSPEWSGRGYVSPDRERTIPLPAGAHEIELELKRTESFGFGFIMAVEGEGLSFKDALF